MIKFKFNSEPKAIQSVRFTKRGHTYQPQKNVDWKNWIKFQTVQQLPEDFKMFYETVEIIKCHFVFAPLKSFSKKKLKLIEDGEIIYKGTKPDLADNLMKGLMDALSGIVFKDDSLVVSVKDTAKYYGMQPGIILELGKLIKTQ